MASMEPGSFDDQARADATLTITLCQVKTLLHRKRFVGGFVNIKIFFCPSKLCILDPVEDS